MSLIPALCDDVSRLIFSLITDTYDILHTRLVNKAWSQAIPHMIRRITCEEPDLHPPISISYISRFPKVEVVEMPIAVKDRGSIAQLPNTLQEFQLEGDHMLSYSIVPALHERYPQASWSINKFSYDGAVQHTKDYIRIDDNDTSQIWNLDVVKKARNLQVLFESLPRELDNLEELGLVAYHIPSGGTLVNTVTAWAHLNPSLKRAYYVNIQYPDAVWYDDRGVKRVINRPFDFDIRLSKKTLLKAMECFPQLTSVTVSDKVSPGFITHLKLKGINVKVASS